MHVSPKHHRFPGVCKLDLKLYASSSSAMLKLEQLECFKHLTHLSLDGCKSVTDDSMRVLAAAASPSLASVSLRHCSQVRGLL